MTVTGGARDKEGDGQSDAPEQRLLLPAWRYVLAATVFFAVALFYDTVIAPTHATVQDREYAWDLDPVYDFLDSPVCTIERVAAAAVTPDAFLRDYLERRPVIIVFEGGVTKGNAAFRDAVQKGSLLAAHGQDSITLSSGNRNSYEKRETTLRHYVTAMMAPQPLDRPGNETWYHFGDPHHLAWAEVARLYRRPVEYLFHFTLSLSFGLAASGTGVPFHTHGHVFAEVLHGRKRWWLSPYHKEPRYDANASTLHWLVHTRPSYSEEETAELQECVCAPGDLLYIPTNWHHATLNIGETVFMSTFI